MASCSSAKAKHDNVCAKSASDESAVATIVNSHSNNAAGKTIEQNPNANAKPNPNSTPNSKPNSNPNSNPESNPTCNRNPNPNADSNPNIGSNPNADANPNIDSASGSDSDYDTDDSLEGIAVNSKRYSSNAKKMTNTHLDSINTPPIKAPALRIARSAAVNWPRFAEVDDEDTNCCRAKGNTPRKKRKHRPPLTLGPEAMHLENIPGHSKGPNRYDSTAEIEHDKDATWTSEIKKIQTFASVANDVRQLFLSNAHDADESFDNQPPVEGIYRWWTTELRVNGMLSPAKEDIPAQEVRAMYAKMYRQLNRHCLVQERRVLEPRLLVNTQRTATLSMGTDNAAKVLDIRSGNALERVVLPLNHIELGPHHITRTGTANGIGVFCEFKFGEESGGTCSIDDAKLIFTVNFPPESGGAHLLLATRPANQTIALAIIIMVYMIANFNFVISGITMGLMWYMWTYFNRQSPFYDARMDGKCGHNCIQLTCHAKDMTGFRYSNRLSEYGTVAIEMDRVERKFRWHDADADSDTDTDTNTTTTTTDTSADTTTTNATVTNTATAPNTTTNTSTNTTTNTDTDTHTNDSAYSDPGPTPDSPPHTPLAVTCNAPRSPMQLPGHHAAKARTTPRLTVFQTNSTKAREQGMEALGPTMLQFRFTDLLMHDMLKSFVLRHEDLTPLCEGGLPGWTTFLASHGLYYRRWVRVLVEGSLWAVSIFFMIVAIVDLLQNVPMVHRLFVWMFGGWCEWFENAVIIRLTSILTLITPQLQIFAVLHRFLKRIGAGLQRACSGCMSVFRSLRQAACCLFRPLICVAQCFGRCCSCCRVAKTVVTTTARTPGAGNSLLKMKMSFMWANNLFKRIIKNGFGRIGVTLSKYLFTITREFKKFRGTLFSGAILVVLVTVCHSLYYCPPEAHGRRIVLALVAVATIVLFFVRLANVAAQKQTKPNPDVTQSEGDRAQAVAAGSDDIKQD